MRSLGEGGLVAAGPQRAGPSQGMDHWTPEGPDCQDHKGSEPQREGGRGRTTDRERERESNRDRETGERESEGPALERTPRRLKSKNIIKVHN